MDIRKKLRPLKNVIEELIVLALIIGDFVVWLSMLVILSPIFVTSALLKEADDYFEKRRLKKRKEKYGF